jgi:hypothetical protein
MIQEEGQTVVVVCRNRNIEMQSGTAVCYDHTRAPIMALTGYYRRNVLDNLQVKATYTVDSYSYKT